ncbi:MAG: hypothetical protein AAF718_07270 [Pseudomonadota bacterium]
MSWSLYNRHAAGCVAVLAVALFVGQGRQPEADASLSAPALPVEIVVPSLPDHSVELAKPPVLKDRTLETLAERRGSCQPNLALAVTPIGFLHATLDAPCHANEYATLEFNGLVADVTLSARGHWEQRLPIIGDKAHVAVQVGPYALEETLSPKRSSVSKVFVLSWRGAQTFAIRAEQEGQAEGIARSDPADLPPLASSVQVGNGTGSAFEILSAPMLPANGTGTVRLSVEGTVTSDNCNRDVFAKAYQTGYLGRLRPTEIAYAMPGCDRAGEIVRLKHLFHDVRLAGR